MQALDDTTDRFQTHIRTVDDHSTEYMGGSEEGRGIGASSVCGVDWVDLRVGDQHQVIGRYWNLQLGQKHEDTVGGVTE